MKGQRRGTVAEAILVLFFACLLVVPLLHHHHLSGHSERTCPACLAGIILLATVFSPVVVVFVLGPGERCPRPRPETVRLGSLPVPDARGPPFC